MAFNSSFSSTQTEGAIAKIIQAIALPDSILSITSETSSSELNAALGGADGFNDLIEKMQLGAINQGIMTTSDGHLASIPVSIYTNVEKTKINIFVQHNGVEREIIITNTDGTLSATVQNKIYFKNDDIYIVGIGGYDGSNADEETTRSLQSVLSSGIDFGSLVETQLNYPADTTIPGTFYYKIRSIDGSAYSGLILYEIFNYEGTLFKNGVFYNTHNNGVIQYDYFEIDGKVIKMSITLNSGEATVQSEILMSQKVLTENEYAALGEAVNTDNTLYFVTPDN